MIRSLREVDFGRFLELARGESWSCDEAELAAFLAVLPDGCLVLEQRAKQAGTDAILARLESISEALLILGAYLDVLVQKGTKKPWYRLVFGPGSGPYE